MAGETVTLSVSEARLAERLFEKAADDLEMQLCIYSKSTDTYRRGRVTIKAYRAAARAIRRQLADR